MQYKKTDFKDLWLLEPTVFEDNRGYFFETFNAKHFEENTGIKPHFVQDNESKSVKGVLRGLHYQLNPMAQAKLVRVIEGEVQDIAVDLRKNSTTYGESYSINLSKENRRQLYIPRGFAHGFLVLSETAVFSYKCDNYYSKENEASIIWDDKDLGIDWLKNGLEISLSEKDKNALTFKEAKNNF